MPAVATLRFFGSAIEWPDRCACCGRASEAVRRICCKRHVRGKAERDEVKCWPIPYCRSCMEHQRCVYMARAATVEKDFVSALPRIKNQLRAQQGVVDVVMSQQDEFNHLKKIYFAQHDASIRQEDHFNTLALQSRSVSCCQYADAVEYLSWDHQSHTFAFHSEFYAGLFVLANKGKVR